MAHEVTDQGFEHDVLQATQPVLVDFWAEWCGPCRRVMPVVEAVGASRSDIKVCKLNVDHNPQTPTKYGVRGIPTLMLFRSGALIGTRVGGDVNESSLGAWIDQTLAQAAQ